MTIDDIEQSLPNGFHDSTITSVHVNYAQRTAEIDMQVLVSGPDSADKEEYRPVKLSISGLLYFVIEPPDHPYTSSEPWVADGGSSEVTEPASQLPKPLPAGAFTYWFFVNDWNSFIHVAALTAHLRPS